MILFYIVKFYIVPDGQMKIAIILEMASRRVKRSEICGSSVVVTGIWGTFDILLFKVILGLVGALV